MDSVTRTTAVMSSEKTLRFMSWNSKGLKTKIEEVKSDIEKQECDVVFLQETRSCESEVLEMLEDYELFYSTQTSENAKAAILIKTNILEETDCTVEKDPAGYYIVVKCILNGQLFTLVNVYSSETNPLLKLRSVLEKHAEGILLIGGDFNVPLNPYLDRTSETKNKIHSLLRPVVEELLTYFNLVDVWRRLHPKQRQYSFEAKHPSKIKSRLDYIFVPEESMQYITSCEISTAKGRSDHYPIVFEISISNEEHKKPKHISWVTVRCNEKQIRKIRKSHNESSHYIYKNWYLVLPDVPDTPVMISVGEVERAIQSLVVNDVERPDGLPLSFYKSYSHVLIPYLCAFYHNILQKLTDIPENFNEANKVSVTHYIFNVDYLILATIMARWLYDHLQAHSADYTIGDKKTTVLFTFKRTLVRVKWSALRHILVKEQDKHWTETPLLDKLKIDALHRMLKNSPSGKRKLLQWGCPLTPVLMTLYLKHVADEMVKSIQDQRASIHISRENVIVRFSHEFDLHLLEKMKEKYIDVDCTTLELSE